MPAIVAKKILTKVWQLNGKRDLARIATLTPASGVAEVCNLAYIDDGHPLHLLDIYYPEGTTRPLPLIVDIHGGGFMYGDKDLNKYFCLDLASRGFAVANLSYRLSPETTLRGQIQDCFAAFRWLSENAGQHFCDLDNVFVTGDSAGGYLSSQACAIMGRDDLPAAFGVTLPSFTFRAAGFTCGAFSPGSLFKRLKFIGTGMKMICLGDDWESYPLLQYLDIADMLEGTTLPPIYMSSSEQDLLLNQSEAFSKQLNACGIAHTFRKWDKIEERKLDHVFNVLHPEWPESIETNEEMLDLFRANTVVKV